MKFDTNEEYFFAHGTSYSLTEEKEARKIRELPNGEEKEFLVKCFEVEMGKLFPFQQGVRVRFNSNGFLDSREIDASCRFIMENPRLTRKHYPLE